MWRNVSWLHSPCPEVVIHYNLHMCTTTPLAQTSNLTLWICHLWNSVTRIWIFDVLHFIFNMWNIILEGKQFNMSSFLGVCHDALFGLLVCQSLCHDYLWLFLYILLFFLCPQPCPVVTLMFLATPHYLTFPSHTCSHSPISPVAYILPSFPKLV